MYAPSSYNDTVTGETLSSVSEKSESYSNDGSQGDYIVSITFDIFKYKQFITVLILCPSVFFNFVTLNVNIITYYSTYISSVNNDF